jgi:hypothetical protein
MPSIIALAAKGWKTASIEQRKFVPGFGVVAQHFKQLGPLPFPSLVSTQLP